MSDFIGRLQEEKNELHSRMLKLKAFLGSDVFNGLGDTQRALLLRQFEAMKTYYGCLNTRLYDLERHNLTQSSD